MIQINIQEFDRLISSWRQDSPIQGDDIWGIQQKIQTIPGCSKPSRRGNHLLFTTEDGFEIEIVFIKYSPLPWYFLGYIKVPPQLPMVHGQALASRGDYGSLQYQWEIDEVEFTYQFGAKLGWDHAHAFEADFRRPLMYQRDKSVKGPVQVLEEAMNIIEKLRDLEVRLQQAEKKKQVDVFLEELMQRVWVPERVAQWVLAGMDI